MGFKLGNKSLSELEGVHPDLVAVVKRAIELTVQDTRRKYCLCPGSSRLRDDLHQVHRNPASRRLIAIRGAESDAERLFRRCHRT